MNLIKALIIILIFSSCSAVFHSSNWHGSSVPGYSKASYKRIPPKNITVRVNKNIELFGLMMQLDLGPDAVANNDTLMLDGRRYAWKDWLRLTINNYLKYQKFDKSKTMDIYRSYSTKGYFNDFFIQFLLQVDEVPFAKINSTTDKDVIMSFSKSGDYNSAEIDANKFLDELNSFYKEVDFAKYLDENAANYQKIKADVLKNLPSSDFVPTMEAFYQKSFNAYYLVPGLNIPTSMGFGISNKNTHSIYNAFGPFTSQSFDSSAVDLGFDNPLRIQGLSVHEFGHSFVNPAIDKVPKELIISTGHLFSPIKDAMTKLSYRSWKVCLYEHFVRAGEVVLAEKLGDKLEAQKILNEAVKKQFVYLPFIVDKLHIYAENIGMYPSYDDYVVNIIEQLKSVK